MQMISQLEGIQWGLQIKHVMKGKTALTNRSLVLLQVAWGGTPASSQPGGQPASNL